MSGLFNFGREKSMLKISLPSNLYARLHTLLWPLLLTLSVCTLYGQFLWNPIVFDDLKFFMVNHEGHQPVDDYQYSPFEIRSLPYATLAWGKALFGLEMMHFRIENMLLHAAVVVALFFFLRRLFVLLGENPGGAAIGGESSQPSASVSKCSPEVWAFCAALLFALHPVAVYTAGYLVQRTMLMATLFGLLAMIAWMRGGASGHRAWLWVTVLCYYFAVFSKEHAIMLPAILLALTALQHEDWFEQLKRRWLPITGFVLVALFVVAAKRGVLGTAYEIDAPEMLIDVGSTELSYPLSVITQGWLFFKYAGLWLFPNPDWMSVDMREPFATSLWSHYLAAFIAFLAWGGAAVWLLFKRGRLGLLGFALLFPWLMFMPEFSTIRIQESFVLYRSYLWAVGACALLPLLLDRLDKRIAGIIVGTAVLAMLPVSMDRLASFSHPLMLWSDAEKLVKDKQDLPGVYRIYYNLSGAHIGMDNYAAAEKDLKIATRLNPDWPFSHNNLGAVLLKQGKWAEAIKEFDLAIEIAARKNMGFNPKPYFGRAMAYENLGMTELSQQDYEVSCRFGKRGCDKLTK
jgi:tetratricopeptide (TPR) repeat protein